MIYSFLRFVFISTISLALPCKIDWLIVYSLFSLYCHSETLPWYLNDIWTIFEHKKNTLSIVGSNDWWGAFYAICRNGLALMHLVLEYQLKASGLVFRVRSFLCFGLGILFHVLKKTLFGGFCLCRITSNLSIGFSLCRIFWHAPMRLFAMPDKFQCLPALPRWARAVRPLL